MTETALIWDLDGTLLDSYDVIASSLQETLEEFQVQMPLEEIRRLAKEGSVSAVVSLAAERSGRPARDIKARYSTISGGRVLDIPAMDHGREALEAAAALGAVHFVYTHRGSTTEPVLEHLGLRHFFKEVVSSLSGFPRKPSPDALLYLMERHRLNRDRVFYIGDRTLDMDCARNAGVRGVLYDPSGAGSADCVVRDLLEIRDVVRDAPGKEREQRENAVRLWFGMWLEKADLGILDLFTADAVYIESWGPEYHGAQKIKFWFDEWNTRGTVLRWDVRQFFHQGDQTVVQWVFRNRMNDGREEDFEGMSLIRWTREGRICFLQEFGCNEDRYDPYAQGPEPQFQGGAALWF